MDGPGPIRWVAATACYSYGDAAPRSVPHLDDRGVGEGLDILVRNGLVKPRSAGCGRSRCCHDGAVMTPQLGYAAPPTIWQDVVRPGAGTPPCRPAAGRW